MRPVVLLEWMKVASDHIRSFRAGDVEGIVSLARLTLGDDAPSMPRLARDFLLHPSFAYDDLLVADFRSSGVERGAAALRVGRAGQPGSVLGGDVARRDRDVAAAGPAGAGGTVIPYSTSSLKQK